jgi:hypothetical protein
MAVPDLIPFTTPDAETEAIEGLLILQVPPALPLVRLTVDPSHTDVGPTIGKTLGKNSSKVSVCQLHLSPLEAELLLIAFTTP